ncbi:PREDICTED: uncharacterized protein LOC104816526 isoform X2 [Tarenaya hassleriana]|nr:PREDICTED: uncharacterized protein LOC104816526 isoform X2 [Tarenaya hassleriana]XP_010543699.1 PREDICTED: uncharacterized protein LOC104816526 isoform X2 [Tarenaya hassleriana]
MGAGRKTETYTVSESLTYWSGSGSIKTNGRNLSKGELGGVIFGCKFSTVKECYAKQLFGLPAPHISYVKNIDPGLTLFLFNYSDRKLHGIFEAASHGKLSIDPHAWTSDGIDTTPYAAQVKVRVRLLCEPLLEEKFSKIIAENYFAEKLFWFELDQSQTYKLIRLFSPLPSKRAPSTYLKAPSPSVSALPPSSSAVLSVSGVNCVAKWSSLFKSSPDLKENSEQFAPEAVTGSKDAINGVNRVAKWSSLFKSSPDLKENSEQFAPEAVTGSKDAINGGASSCFNPVASKKSKGLEIAMNDGGMQKAHSLVSHFRPSYSSVVRNTNPSSIQSRETYEGVSATANRTVIRHQISSHETKEDPSNCAHSGVDNIDWDASSFQLHLDGLNRILEDSVENDFCNGYGEVPLSQNWNMEQSSWCLLSNWDYESHPLDFEEFDLKKSTCSSSHISAIAGDVVDNIGEGKEKFMDLCQQGAEMGTAACKALVAELLMEVKDLKLSQRQQTDRMNSLEKELIESRKEICRLKGQSTSSEAEEFQSLNECFPDSEETILVIGGSDGSSWLSTLDCYSLSKDKLKSFCPMTSCRSYAAVAMLNGEVYMIGGIHEYFSVATVESFNHEKNEWVWRPSLNQRKGNLAAVSLNDKIFALGGGDGSQPFENVEMLDLQIAKWINTQPMIEKRFAPAATEINGALYVVGGYDGTDYLKSVERYDPREASWTMLECMSTKRGWHSLVALHEKLYGIGGHNGDKMVPTVEVFDPRAPRWISEESMNQGRGYFGSVVIGDAIYVLGGIDDNGNLLDSVECYMEGYGWQLMDQKGFGRRSFFSALLF